MFGQIGGRSIYGTGEYSQNIIQGGSVLQPQDYDLGGVILPGCIVVTGAATVAPDATTLASVFMCRNLVIIGSGASLAPAANSKGLIPYVRERMRLLDNARMHIDKLGYTVNTGNLNAHDLTPAALAAKVARPKLAQFVVLGEGAAGGPQGFSPTAGVAAALPMQSGGGGSGGMGAGGPPGGGGKGGPCGGGASGGGNHTSSAGPYGGPGGDSHANAARGVGHPGGASGGSDGGSNPYPDGAGGGLLMTFCPSVVIESGCIVSADGANGGAGTAYGSGGAGGGIVVFVTKPGGYTNNGTVRANGGLRGVMTYPAYDGGAGSVNIFTHDD